MGLAAALLLFALNSYPMMRPGFDVWWHMGMITAPQQADPQVFPAGRIAWHHAWHYLLNALHIDEFFERSLWVHRTQFVATLVLLSSAAYAVLRALTVQLQWAFTAGRSAELWFAAIGSSAIWLLMHGTASTPHGGDMPLVASWIVWYSVNYQISLPLYFAGTAALLYALNTAKGAASRATALLLCLVCIGLGTLFHAAETAYFLICLVFLGFLHLRGRKGWLVLGAVLLAALAVLVAVLQMSYATPEFLSLIAQGQASTLANRMFEQGDVIVNQGLGRQGTGWHVMHFVSLAALCAAAVLLWRLPPQTGYRTALNSRAFSFVVLSAAMPLALKFVASAGLLASLTNVYIAWRFSLASFLFVGIPLLALVATCALNIRRASARLLFAAACNATLVLGCLAWSSHAEPERAALRFGESLLRSLDAGDSRFGLVPEQRHQLRQLASALTAIRPEGLLCTDQFTAYYLFFLEGYRAVSLPPALSYVPGYVGTMDTCQFDARNETLRRLQLAPLVPEWGP